MTMPLQWDYQAMLITTYKEANQLQSSCISLPTATVHVVTPHMQCGKPSASLWHASLVCGVCLLFCVRTTKLCATVPAHASFLSFAYVKRTSIRVCLYACVKFKLSCTIPNYYYVTVPVKTLHVSIFYEVPLKQLQVPYMYVRRYVYQPSFSLCLLLWANILCYCVIIFVLLK